MENNLKKVNCNFCKKEYFVHSYVYNLIISGKQKSNCCSKECSDKLKIIINAEKRKSWSKLICDYCKKEFVVKPFEYKHKLENELFISCNRECAQKLMGINHRGDKNCKYIEKNKTNCLFCGKEYEIYDDQIGINKYCSKECQGKDKSKNATIILQCQYCGNNFNSLKGIVNFWGRIKYCSEECRKSARIKKAEMICVICGKHYFVSNNRKNISICCSYKCKYEWDSTIYTQRPEVKQRLREQGIRSCKNQNKKYTLPEMLVLEYLEYNHINFIPQYIIGDILTVDFFIPEYNCVLEVYGDYWHGNPRKYGVDKKLLSEMQIKNKQKDIRRYKVLTKKYDFYFYALWEYDIKNDLQNSMNKFFKYIKSKIRNE